MEYILRKAELKDLENCYNLTVDKDVYNKSIKIKSLTMIKYKKEFNLFLNSKEVEFYIIEGKFGLFLGIIRFETNLSKATIFIVLSKNIRGKGYAKEILKSALIKFGAEKEESKIVLAYIYNDNIASIKLFKSVGFKIEYKQGKLDKYSLDI